MFIDVAKIFIKAGDGGDGAVAFHREKYVAAGGPDGGNGGKGGNIVFQVDTNLSTLLDFRYHKKYVAKRGENGGAKRCTGKSAPDLVIKVPRGTIVRNAKNGRIMADLSTDEPQILAKGGNGGRGNCNFATSTRQIPRFAKPGFPGEEFEVILELKLLADVGLVGYPNVGKSTLFNCLSGCERSIVTEIAGTTRDVIEESVKIGDLTLRLSDTAGIRDTDDVIEGIGVNIAYKRLDEAQLIIAVFDGSCPLTEDDVNLLKKLKDKKAIAVINKNDVEQKIDSDIIKSNNIQIVYISAKENKGIQEVQQAIESLFEANELDFESGTAANERQKRCIDLCLQQIDEAISALESGVLLDAITVLLDEAVQHILELTGEKATVAVVDEVFSRFCVGK